MNELYHYGVKGQKWGVRRYQKKARDLPNPNYSDKQRKQDRALYGTRGEKRINRRLNDGNSIVGARHYEAARKARARKVARGASIAGSVLGTIGSAYVADQVYNNGAGTRAVTNAIKNLGR